MAVDKYQVKSIEQQTLETLLRIEKLLEPRPVPRQYVDRATLAKEFPDPRKKGK